MSNITCLILQKHFCDRFEYFEYLFITQRDNILRHTTVVVVAVVQILAWLKFAIMTQDKLWINKTFKGFEILL